MHWNGLSDDYLEGVLVIPVLHFLKEPPHSTCTPICHWATPPPNTQPLNPFNPRLTPFKEKKRLTWIKEVRINNIASMLLHISQQNQLYSGDSNPLILYIQRHFLQPFSEIRIFNHILTTSYSQVNFVTSLPHTINVPHSNSQSSIGIQDNSKSLGVCVQKLILRYSYILSL